MRVSDQDIGTGHILPALCGPQMLLLLSCSEPLLLSGHWQGQGQGASAGIWSSLLPCFLLRAALGCEPWLPCSPWALGLRPSIPGLLGSAGLIHCAPCPISLSRHELSLAGLFLISQRKLCFAEDFGNHCLRSCFKKLFLIKELI